MKRKVKDTKSKLAPELWKLITSSLSQCDIAILCCTSSTLLKILRVVLYEEVSLTNRHDATIKLLLSDKTVSGSVLTFKFENRRLSPKYDPDTTKAIQAAMKMTRLQKLHFSVNSAFLFQDLSQEKKFLDHFNNRKIPLQEFGYTNRSVDTRSTRFGLKNLTSLVWADEACEYGSSSYCINMLTST